MRIKRILKYVGISVAILILGFLAVAQITYQSIPEIEPPGKMYYVNGGEIHMYCTGPNNEKPTIIIISGGGTASLEYFYLQEKLSQTVRTCSYDTAGIGWSPANDIPYTTKNMSDELYRLLQTARIDGPIILAGHSVGGITSLIYSAEHEEQVAGIAFIDSSHYNQTDYFGKEFEDAFDKEMKESLANFWLIELGNNLGILNLLGIWNHPELDNDEKDGERRASMYKWNPPFPAIKSMISNLNLSIEQGKDAHYDRGDLPIIVISAAGPTAGDSREIGDISIMEYRKGIDKLHKDLAELSSNGKHVFVNGTSHTSIVVNDETAEHVLSLIPNVKS
ncbi:alpha/beta hydrolase [Nitrosopumilus sp.]|uniref:alpha/beta hydrolase n=1 Tax=Nitrosopumilus sp. TaxID=2024843 RepID=UPI00292DA847|nr:alpha/beta fold hydrolase [Nitrosopumilus sp.]